MPKHIYSKPYWLRIDSLRYPVLTVLEDDIDNEYNKNFEKKFNELFEKRMNYYIKLKIDNLIEKVSNMKSYIIFYPTLYITKKVLNIFSNMFEEKLDEIIVLPNENNFKDISTSERHDIYVNKREQENKDIENIIKKNAETQSFSEFMRERDTIVNKVYEKKIKEMFDTENCEKK